jgi:ABC-type multidrug transport system ATPase subunit
MAKRKRPAAKPSNAFEAEGLTKEYGDIVALAPLDLTIDPGHLVALIGHNGSGKSTLMKMAAGLLDSSGGTARIHGKAAGSLPARARLSYLPDAPVLYDDLSVVEHVEYVSRLHGTDDWIEKGAQLIESFGLVQRADDLPVGFSRGLRQKTALVLGLVRPYTVLMIDEPFVGLDQSGKKALLDAIDAARDQGKTVIVATHDLDLVERTDRCLALRDGELVHDGPVDPNELLALAG